MRSADQLQCNDACSIPDLVAESSVIDRAREDHGAHAERSDGDAALSSVGIAWHRDSFRENGDHALQQIAISLFYAWTGTRSVGGQGDHGAMAFDIFQVRVRQVGIHHIASM